MATAIHEPAPGRTKMPSFKNVVIGSEKYALPAAWVLVLVGFSILLPSTYSTVGNIQNIFGSQGVLLILSLGLLFALTAGEFDLSAASTMSLTAMTLSVLNAQQGVPLAAAIAASVGVAAVAGLVNALLVVVLRIDSFIATLGSSTVMLGIVQWMSKGGTVTGIDPALVQATVGFRGLMGLPLQFFYGVAVAVVIFVILTSTPVGRRLLFVGRSAQVSHLSGLNVNRIRAGAFMGTALTSSVAGIIYAGSLSGADPASGQSFLLPAFAACYLGATAITPGRFNVAGTFIAVFFLFSGVVGLQMMGAQNFVQQLFYGSALVVAVAVSQAIRRHSATTR